MVIQADSRLPVIVGDTNRAEQRGPILLTEASAESLTLSASLPEKLKLFSAPITILATIITLPARTQSLSRRCGLHKQGFHMPVRGTPAVPSQTVMLRV